MTGAWAFGELARIVPIISEFDLDRVNYELKACVINDAIVVELTPFRRGKQIRIEILENEERVFLTKIGRDQGENPYHPYPSANDIRDAMRWLLNP